jgi:hypothetical protein
MITRLTILFFILCYNISSSTAQSIDKRNYIQLKSKEDSLTAIGVKIINSTDLTERFRSDSLFTRTLVRALKIQYSFQYSFDSITTVSKIYSPDSLFRIFTWQVTIDENTQRRHGAIQMKTADGSLKLFPLIDRSIIIKNQLDTVTNNEWWIGAIYYKIVKKLYNNKPYYTLLGYDENTMRSTKKWIEVLHFDDKGLPQFGGQFFSFKQDSIKLPTQSRFSIEFKKDGNGRIMYDTDLDMLIYDHLISETNEETKKYTYIPDGDYEGFKWVNGQWLHINKVFTQKLLDGQAPVEKPIKQ